MNSTVKFHSERIIEISKNNDCFAINQSPAIVVSDSSIKYLFTLSNVKDDSTFSYICLVQNVEMALDIIEESHILLECDFDRESAKKEFSKLTSRLDLSKLIYLCYEKRIVWDTPT